MKYIDPSETLRTTNPDGKFHPINNTEMAILDICNEVADLLIKKNRAYGNSALEPVRIFSKSDEKEQLKVRIDDKLSRFAKGENFPGDNDIDDLIGYLVLLKVALRNNWRG
jgi:hypothetical protein